MNVRTATTAELVAFYNANVAADKQIKKFADRATAERRVSNLSAYYEASDEELAQEQEAAVQSSVYGFEVHGLYDCPHCDIHLSNGVSQHGDDVNGKPLRHDTHEFECMGCGGGFGKTLRHAAKSTSRANAIAATWNDPQIAAARAQRTCVRVYDGFDDIIGEYKSTAEAFRRLGLPLSKHIPFRMALKAAGSKTFAAYTFKVVA
jgi:hypothetical protein